MILILRYREASVEVMEIMSHFAVIERASIDEAYIDLTSAVQERLQKLQGQPISAERVPDHLRLHIVRTCLKTNNNKTFNWEGI